MLGSIWRAIRTAVSEFFEDEATTLSGALAFYTALSLAPLLVMVIWIAAAVWGDGASDRFVSQIRTAIGEQPAEIIRTVIEHADQPGSGLTAKAIGIATLVLGATGVFAQLQYSLNKIWDVQAKPGMGAWNWIRKRVLSLGMVLAIAFVLLVSLVISAVLSGIMSSAGDRLPGQAYLWRVLEFATSMLVYWLLFALMYKLLPDVRIDWGDVALGAAITAILFTVGKFVIGLYLGRSTTSDVYGAAGSLVVLLLWVYYSSLIVFLGAELTQAYARVRGVRLEPNRYAVRIGRKEAESARVGTPRSSQA